MNRESLNENYITSVQEILSIKDLNLYFSGILII